MNYTLNALNYLDAASLLSSSMSYQQPYNFVYQNQPAKIDSAFLQTNPAQHAASSQSNNRPSSVSSSISSKSVSPSSTSSSASHPHQFNPLLNSPSQYLSTQNAIYNSQTVSTASSTSTTNGLHSLIAASSTQSGLSPSQLGLLNASRADSINFQQNYTNMAHTNKGL
jgi:hypothetical protein